MRDNELVRRVIADEPGAFEELFYKYVDRVYRHVTAIVGPGADVEDLTQAVFIRVHRSIARYRSACSFSTWLHRVTVNVALNHLRDTRKLRGHEDFDETAASVAHLVPSLVEHTEQREHLRLMYQLLDRLTERKRVVFVLYEIEGYTLEETASIVACSANTVASRLRAARQELRRAMQQHMAQERIELRETG